jgi:N4-gp56 family major capsid protein
MAKLVNTDFSDMVQGKGDTVNIPTVTNLTANDKVIKTAVTVQAPDESCLSITINKHKEVSFLVEDFVEIQSSVNLRSIYTKRAGYAIAKVIDDDLITQAGTCFDCIDATSTGNASVLSEEEILLAKTLLDENDTPMEDRHLVVAPQQYNELLKIDRFTEHRMLDNSGAPIQSGLLGSIHGFTVWMTQQLAATGTGTADTVDSLAFHRDSIALLIQLRPRVQANYIPEYLGWLVTVDVIYGLGCLRDDWGYVLQTDAITYSTCA